MKTEIQVATLTKTKKDIYTPVLQQDKDTT
jgi:hypothetical protein